MCEQNREKRVFLFSPENFFFALLPPFPNPLSRNPPMTSTKKTIIIHLMRDTAAAAMRNLKEIATITNYNCYNKTLFCCFSRQKEKTVERGSDFHKREKCAISYIFLLPQSTYVEFRTMKMLNQPTPPTPLPLVFLVFSF